MNELMSMFSQNAGAAFVFGVACAGVIIGLLVAVVGGRAVKIWAREFGGWKKAVAAGAESMKPLADVGDRMARLEADVHAIRDLLRDVPSAIASSNQAIEVAVQHGDEMNEVRARLAGMEGELRKIRDELITAVLDNRSHRG